MTVNQTFRGKADLTTLGILLEKNYIGVTTPGSLVDLITYTVPLGKELVAIQIFSTCRLESKITIKVNSDQIASGRMGPGNLNNSYIFTPYRELIAGDILKIDCFAMSGRPATDIEIYLQARLISI